MSWNEAIWKKYLDGKATKEELELLDAYFQSGNLAEWNACIAKEPLSDTPMPPEKEAQLRRYLQHMGKPKARILPLLTVRRVAAAVAVILLVGAGFFFRPQKWNMRAQTAGPAGWDTIGPAADMVRMITLGDGTKVWLNRGAGLLVSKAYPAERNVLLKGEGYFEVVADKAHPFSVQTGQVRTLVLGTAFNIEHTSADKAVRVSLIAGKVKVMHQKDTTAALTLTPGHMAVAADSPVKLSSAEIDVTTAAAWIKGDLVMNNIPLSDALSKLAAYYNIQITCPAKLAEGKTVTALYHRHQPWKQVLQHMLFIVQLTYVTDQNGTIHIAKN